MNFDEEEVVAYTRSAIISVTALELPLLLKGGRSGAVGDMVRELRSSSVAINGALRSLRDSGLVICDADGTCRYQPASKALERYADELEKLYAIKLLSVIRAIAALFS